MNFKAMQIPQPTDPTQFATYAEQRFNAGDIDGVMNLIEPEATLNFPDGQIAFGADAIRAEVARAQSAGLQVSLTHVSVTLQGDFADAVTRWSFSTHPSAEGLRPLAGTLAHLLRQGPDGVWRHLVDLTPPYILTTDPRELPAAQSLNKPRTLNS
jgi:ketosteroid isomerase-like protein